MYLDSDSTVAHGQRRYVTLIAEPPASLWDERYGWSLALKTPVSARLMKLGYLVAGPLPATRVVAEYVTRACADGEFDTPEPAALDIDGDLADRTTAVAGLAALPGYYP